MVFAGPNGVYSQDNQNFFWDDANKRLGIGTNAPTEKFHIQNGGILIDNIYTLPQTPEPTFAGSYSTQDNAFSVFVSGNYAYVAEGESGLEIIDISDPENPIYVGSYDTLGEAVKVYVSGKYAYIADGGFGLQIIDVSDPANPVLVGNYNNSEGSVDDVFVSGNYAYFTTETEGPSIFRIINVSDKTNPISVGYYSGNANQYKSFIFLVIMLMLGLMGVICESLIFPIFLT